MNLRWLAAGGLVVIAAGALAILSDSGLIGMVGSSPNGPPFLKTPALARTLDGDKVDFQAPDSGVAVVVFYSTECPIAAASMPNLARLSKEIPAARMFLLGVCVDPDADREAIVRYGREHGIEFPTVHDPDGRLVRQFGVKVVPEAFVLDERGRLRYRGRIDGQYQVRGRRIPGPANADLLDAVRAVLADGPAPTPYLEPVGCPVPEYRTATSERPAPTYHSDVAPILRRSCQACHRPGQSGPFPLTAYAQAAKRSRDLANVTSERLMPPWKPEPGVGPPLKHDWTLLPSEIETLKAWADTGAPEGPQAAEAPAPHRPSTEWTLGKPDLIVEMAEPFAVPATGDDLYRCFVMPTALAQDGFISAIEVQPGNPRVVHHTFGYVDTRGLGRDRDARDPLPGYPCFSGFSGDQIFGLLGGWTPGNEAHPFGEGVGLELPRNADIVMQVHYHPSGKPEIDRTRLGLYFSRKPVRQALEWVSACPEVSKFYLPAGDPEVKIRTSLEVPIPVALHAMTPHMHLLGREFRARAILPGGRVRPLIEIKDWDFNRQDTYYLREPLSLPAGTIIDIEGIFDNSAANPRNPSRPPRDILWGEATTDDMLILFLALTQDGQDLSQTGAKNTFMEEFFKGEAPTVTPGPKPQAPEHPSGPTP